MYPIESILNRTVSWTLKLSSNVYFLLKNQNEKINIQAIHFLNLRDVRIHSQGYIVHTQANKTGVLF